MSGTHRIAVIADAHVHDPEADFGLAGALCGEPALRGLADTAKSPRALNETSAAFAAALADIAARGIRDVVLLGDYSDDGQAATLAALSRRMADASARLGLRFHAVPGNHDVFGEEGRHRTRRFRRTDGRLVLATSDPLRAAAPGETLALVPGMAAAGYGAGLRAMAGAGFFPRPSDLYWETPFGREPALGARRHAIRSRDGLATAEITDASYLVEPVAGLWLLMIDANVFRPHDRAERPRHREDVADSGDAGWRELHGAKPHLMPWIADVAARARAGGRTLIAFSHYPVLDPFRGAGEAALLPVGGAAIARRMPGPEAAEALLAAGVALHFGGHLHMDAVTRETVAGGAFTDVSLPPLAGFPGAYRILTIGEGHVTVEAAGVGGMAMPEEIARRYRAEAAADPRLPDALAMAEDYRAFTGALARHVTMRRHARRNRSAAWQAALGQVRMSGTGGAVPAATFVEDLALLLSGGAEGRLALPPERLALYAGGPLHPEAAEGVPEEVVGDLRDMARLLPRALAHPGDVTIRIADGAIVSRGGAPAER